MNEMNTTTPVADTEVQPLIGGSRRWQQGSEEEDGQPLITIITSTFNAAQDLHWTIDSIRAQTYPRIQWIVADGGSKDGTVDVLRQNEDIIDVWFSAPDKGIYDAWNKALEYVRGEWVQFIGAGDELAEADTLTKVAPYLAKAHPEFDIVYGKLAFISEGKRQLIEEVGEPWEEMKGKWEGYRPKLPAHPSVFHHGNLFSDNKFRRFDVSYKITSDTHFLMCHLKKELLYIPVVVDRMPIGGVSSRTDSFKTSLRETRRASNELGLAIPLLHLLLENLKFSIRSFIVLLFGTEKSRFVYDFCRRLVRKKEKWSVG